MIIEKVQIQNFRLLKDFELDLKEGLSLVVGKNNCGKTSILTVMEKLFNSNNSDFRWEDFNLEFQEYFRQEVLNYTRREGETQNFGGIKMTVFIKYSQSDSYANIQNFMMDLNPDNNVIVLEFYYSCKEDKIQKLQNDLLVSKITNADADFDKFTKFMKKNSSKYFSLSRYSRGYDIESKSLTMDFSEELKMSEIKKLIRFKYIKANRDASNKANDHSLSNLSANYYKLKKDSETVVLDDLQKIIEETDKELNKVYNGHNGTQGIFSEIISSVNTFGGHSDETRITIQSSIEDKDLLKDNTTLYYEHSGKHLPESYNGLGYLNLIGMIFEIETIIADFFGENDPSDINVLFIEEPEAHTHPQLQYIFIKNIKKLIESRRIKNGITLGLQTIISTHSSYIVSECNFDDIRYLKVESNGIKSKNFESLKSDYASDPQAFKFVKQYLNLNRSELFFADKAVFIEGDTERILLPAMMQKIDEVDSESLPLLSQNISIIESGAYSHKFLPLMKFIGLKVLIITDIDGAKKNGNDRLESCSPEVATHTTNASLKFFYALLDDKEHLDTLKNRTFENKIFDNQYCVLYQTLDRSYQANSFEDAFICTNLDFIHANKDKFKQGLKNRGRIDTDSKNYYEIGQNCINKKSAFATEILYFDRATDDKTWQVPTYIKEGLTWLKEQ